MNKSRFLIILGLTGIILALNVTFVHAQPPLIETEFFKKDVAAGIIPKVQDRVPEVPFVVPLGTGNKTVGRPGGTMRVLGGRSKDTRLMVVYGYSRLVGYNEKFEIVADIVERFEAVDERIFTFHLRKGHRWSDGHPFTSEDFRYYWEDFANNPEASKMGLPNVLMVEGEAPRVEIIDEVTVRYSWSKPNPFFLPALAAAQPIYIFRPAHYLKQFHPKYTDLETLDKKIKAVGKRNWVALHFFYDKAYKNNNPDRPTLQPWALKTLPPSDRYIFERNPYYYRVDPQGNQLPYVDTVAMTIASAKLIPAKTGSGESDLQARYLSLNNYTFLKQGEKRHGFKVRRWPSGKGAKVALFPNLNVKDPAWNLLFRNPDFRRGLSLSINRYDINQVIYYGLALEGNNTVLPQSELSLASYRQKWTEYNPQKANQMFDQLGLAKRNGEGMRLLPDGRAMEIIVETAGEDTEQTDVLDLIRDDWRKVGIKLFIKPLQMEVFRRRIFSGASMMSIGFGLENAIPTAMTSPAELAPTSQMQFQWPRWGQFFDTKGHIGEPPDIPEANRLLSLNTAWNVASRRAEKERIWHEMLEINADQVFSIGIVAGVAQLVVINDRLNNVPVEAIYNWEPGAQFGIYRPDTFWFSPMDAEKTQ